MKPVYSQDCDCELLAATVIVAKTDAAAARLFAERKLAFVQDPDHRYWCVHGPGGHVVSVR